MALGQGSAEDLAGKLLRAQILTVVNGSESNSWSGCVLGSLIQSKDPLQRFEGPAHTSSLGDKELVLKLAYTCLCMLNFMKSLKAALLRP